MSRLAYRVDGPSAAPVVLAGPSLGTTTMVWDRQVEALSQHYRLVRFDLPSHGDSPVPDGPITMADLGRMAIGVLDEIGVSTASYLGVSLGGMIGMWAAAYLPDRVDRLMLSCTSAYLPPAAGWLQRAAQVRENGAVSVADAVMARWFTPAFRDQEPETVQRFRALIASTGSEGYARCCEAIAGMDLRPDLPGIGVPTLVIAGHEDPSTPPEHSASIAGAIPGARLVILDNAAHLANVERASEVTALLTEFLEGR